MGALISAPRGSSSTWAGAGRACLPHCALSPSDRRCAPGAAGDPCALRPGRPFAAVPVHLRCSADSFQPPDASSRVHVYIPAGSLNTTSYPDAANDAALKLVNYGPTQHHAGTRRKASRVTASQLLAGRARSGGGLALASWPAGMMKDHRQLWGLRGA